ncbi:MAG: hypothetical protein IJ849_11265 [Selenomonadaceae bacterium]|nr:hypothetical protein [Selenomonadaceae bacterium]
MAISAAVIDWLKNSCRVGVGVYCKHASLYFARVEKSGNDWAVTNTAQLPFYVGADTEPLVREKIAAAWETLGWGEAAVGLTLAADEVFKLRLTLPPNMDDEAREAIRWEIAGEATYEKEFSYDYRLISPHTYEAVAISGEQLSNLIGDVEAAEIEFSSLTVLTDESPPRPNVLQGEKGAAAWEEDGLRQAVHGALSAASKDYAHWELLPSPKTEGWNYRRIAKAIQILTVTALFIWGGIDVWRYRESAQTLAAAQYNLSLRQAEIADKEAALSLKQRIARRDEALQSLGKDALYWRSILVHLGYLTTDGVRVDSLDLNRDGRLVLKGEAVSYDALADFLELFAGDGEFFPAPLLKEATTKPDQAEKILFTLHFPAPKE